MSHVEINRSKEPIRLFKSDVLEFFTHISPVVVLVIWLPVVIIAMAMAASLRAGGHVLALHARQASSPASSCGRSSNTHCTVSSSTSSRERPGRNVRRSSFTACTTPNRCAKRGW